MNGLLYFVFSDGGLVVSVLVAALWVALRPQSKRARRFLMSVTFGYTIATMYPVSFAANRLLAAGYHALVPTDVPPGRTAVIVLGSGSYTIHDWSGNEYSGPDGFAASRALEAARVYKLVNPEWVISSGGKIRPDDVAQATGEATRNLLVQLGLPADRVLVQSKSRNTREEAQMDLEIVRGLKADHVVLVTSDFHMRRSIGAFRAQGVEAIPAITRDPFPARSWQDWVVPGDEGLWGSASVAHEVLGIGYYAARGWYRF